jgi:small subunit ribosomal protein S17
MVKPLKGIVVSNKMMKSVTVMVERIYKHPRWGKYVRGRKKYMGASEAPRGIPKPLSRS